MTHAVDNTQALAIVRQHMEDVGDVAFRIADVGLPTDIARALVDEHYVVVGADGFVDDVADAPRHPTRTHAPDTAISWVGPNPKRAGTLTHERFELFRTSDTVEDYVRAATSGPAATTRKQALLDVRWAESRGQIRLGTTAEADPAEEDMPIAAE